MKRGNEEFSDRKVTIFLIAAIFISLVSTLTVLITLHEVTNKDTKDQTIRPEATNIGPGFISLTVLEPEEPVNGTKQ